MMTKKAKKKEIIALISTGLVILVSVIGIIIFAKASRSEKHVEVDGSTAVQEQKNQTKEEKPKEEYTSELSDGSKVNTSKEMQKTKELDGLQITNIQLKEKGGITTLLADIENKTNETIKEKSIEIEVLDKSGKVITTVRGFTDEVEAGGKAQLNMSVTADISNAYDFRIKNR